MRIIPYDKFFKELESIPDCETLGDDNVTYANLAEIMDMACEFSEEIEVEDVKASDNV